MKKAYLKLLSCVAALGIASLAQGLTIVPTFDSSITSDPHGPAITNAIMLAIQIMQSNLTDTATVNIKFVSDETVGLGESQTWGGDFAYASFLTALRARATSQTDTNALSKLPASSTDPVIGGTQIHVTLPQARLLGMASGYGPDGFDATIALKMSLMNFTRPPTVSTNYDLTATVEHEMDEVLGISSGLPTTSEVWPVDLFRYTTNLVRTFTTNGDDAYFSADGTNLVARYNMDASGDYGDWWSSTGSFWSPPGVAPHSQVQDAFATQDSYEDQGASELTALDVVGWTLAAKAASTGNPVLSIKRTGVNQFTVSWSGTASGYVLQESTNLVSGWANSASGSTNPANIVSATARKFYRLYKASTPGEFALAQAAEPVQLQLTTRSYRPRGY